MLPRATDGTNLFRTLAFSRISLCFSAINFRIVAADDNHAMIINLIAAIIVSVLSTRDTAQEYILSIVKHPLDLFAFDIYARCYVVALYAV